MESEEGRYAFSAIGLSVSLFVLWRCDVLPEGRRRRDGQSQRSAVKSRLWLMNRGELPSHWDEFTLSHNHSLFSPQLLSPFGIHIFIFFCLRPSVALSFFPLLFVASWSVTLVQVFFSLPALLYAYVLSFFSFVLLLFILHAMNLCTFAASGIRTTTRSPGASSTQPTNTR